MSFEVLKRQVHVLRCIALQRNNAHIAFCYHAPYRVMYAINEGSIYEFMQSCTVPTRNYVLWPLIPQAIQLPRVYRSGSWEIEDFQIYWAMCRVFIRRFYHPSKLIAQRRGDYFVTITVNEESIWFLHDISFGGQKDGFLRRWIDYYKDFSLKMPYKEARKYFYNYSKTFRALKRLK